MAVEPDKLRARDEAVAPTVMATGPLSAHDPSSPPAEEFAERPRGALLGRYIVVDRLGVGGMGVVYTAFDPELDRKVAIKLLQHRGKGSMGPARLLREAKAMARLSHPGVITVHDVGLVDDQVFIAMELVEGGTLREWVAAEKRSWREVVSVFIKAGEGLAAAHDAGLVHRDFKPDNVLVGDDGRVRVLDFGLAQAVDDNASSADSGQGKLHGAPASAPSSSNLLRSAGISELAHTESGLSQDGAIIGTPAYMAPEQHLGAEVDARSDIFAFCIALWEALYDQHPYAAESRLSMVYALTKGELQAPPSDRRIPRWLHALVVRGLRPKPEDRPPNMRALLDALRRGRRRRKQMIWTATVILLLLISATMTWVALSKPVAAGPCQGSTDRLLGVWDPGVEDKLAKAFAGSDVAYADATWRSVREDLSGYASAWATMHVDTCEATQLRGEQSAELMDLRMACLEGHLQEFAALTEVLAEAAEEPALISRAKSASTALPALARCADVAALTSGVHPPDDLGRRRALDDVQARLARIRARLNAGQLREALRLLPTVADRAEAVDHPPALAEVAYLRGQLHDRNGDVEEAETALVDAALLATANHQDRLAAAAMVELIYTVGVRQARADDALLWSRLAAATLDRLQPSKERSLLAARRLDREGLVLAQRGDLVGGRARQEKAVELAEASVGRETLAAAALRLNLSSTLADLGELDPAQVHLEAAIRILGEELGADHPHVAVAHNNLGALLDSLGAPEEALAQHQRSLAIKERSLGADHPSTANSHNNIAASMIHLGDLEGAVPHIDRALEIKRTVYGEDSPLLAETLSLRAEVALRRDELDLAVEASKQALKLANGFDEGQANPMMIPLHRIRAQTAAALGDDALAEEHFQAALTVHEEVGGDPVNYGEAALAYADFLWRAPNTRPRARQPIDDALARAESGELILGRHRALLLAWLDEHARERDPS